MKYKPSKKIITLIKEAHELLSEENVIESISKLITAMEQMYVETKRKDMEEKTNAGNS